MIDIFSNLEYCVLLERWWIRLAKDTDFFKLLYNHLNERPINNAFEQLKQDEHYQEASRAECEIAKKCSNMELTEKQQKAVEEWIDCVHAESAAYSMVVFRMGMQCCFSLIMQLADLK